jgi:chaperonin GroES
MADVKLAPLGDRVVVEPIEQDEVTASGIVLPDSAKDKPQRGKIIAAGPGRVEEGKRIDMEVKVGDVVIYARYAGTEYKVENNKKVLILAEKDILAKVLG